MDIFQCNKGKLTETSDWKQVANKYDQKHLVIDNMLFSADLRPTRARDDLLEGLKESSGRWHGAADEAILPLDQNSRDKSSYLQ